ncbi:tautomerase family protein [Photorhabdus hindustanensis]
MDALNLADISVANGIVEVFGVNRDEIYIVVDQVHPDHLFVRGQLWNQ